VARAGMYQTPKTKNLVSNFVISLSSIPTSFLLTHSLVIRLNIIRFFFGKNTVMQLALGKSEEDETKPNLHLIADVRNPAIIYVEDFKFILLTIRIKLSHNIKRRELLAIAVCSCPTSL